MKVGSYDGLGHLNLTIYISLRYSIKLNFMWKQWLLGITGHNSPYWTTIHLFIPMFRIDLNRLKIKEPPHDPI